MYEIESVYEKIGIDRPERLDSGMAVWTLVERIDTADIVYCANPATDDSRDLRIQSDGYPEKIDDRPIYSDSGGLNQEISEIPIRVIIKENYGGHLEGWIRTWTTNPKELRENSLFQDHVREEGIEWDGTQQAISPEKIKQRSSVFSEDDVRGSKNDLIK
ncbi:hypothetical protein EGH21_21360 [Halomicroarcula sp. F13]|uniref:Uncharacterized protein n=1 Tax=Haloarcula rubra TaxID=2487747 RepID=A0AAW4PY89_9EURY|nr:hypothetical protein [Halomicroarcula rubra]MBX0325576.1 hypothetical protein [Halomicroarcula rubra]